MAITRRTFNAGLLSGLALAVPSVFSGVKAQGLLQKTIPSSNELIPLVGLGSWITFNVGSDLRAVQSVAAVIKTFFEEGGRMIDSSPMYGSSQATIGRALEQLSVSNELMAVDKVWTNGKRNGAEQIQESLSRWGLQQFSLLQVHNLRDWQAHLETLFSMKDQKQLRYVGITTSHGRRHRAVEHILERYPIDFLQLTYNMSDREAERRLLPLAKERGVAVIVNRPFDGGRLIRRLKRHAFPEWATGEGFSDWADFVLKYNVSHEAVTCAIPATTKVAHVRENMTASRGTLPDNRLRQRMLQYVEDL